MENPAATLHCPNTRCQAPNPQSNKFCQNCRTPLLRRYLWALGQDIDAYKPGEVLAGRYVVVRQRIVLDTQPGMPPETPQEIPQELAPYLKLSPYGLHLPQVYGQLSLTQGRRHSQVWLLEDAPIYAGGSLQGKEARYVEGQLFPQLTSVWKDAPAMRQLNWLWQLANLWQPLSSEGVASSLLVPDLLRVEGSIVRLLALQPDTRSAPTLQQLGQLWSQGLAGASSSIAEFFQHLCVQLDEGQIRSSDELVALLDGALKNGGRSQSRSYQIYTRTDSGPSRPHNEDACYPPSGQLARPSTGTSALAIVCDGIGGHEGGEVASHLAIEALRERVEKLPADPDNWNPVTLTLELEEAACEANDVISQQNDSEHRSDRQRMGTTLVMARTCAHEMYITHVGDSRVYWVTKNNCHQVTQDDDLASREVRLGYALYRNAIQLPTSGSLVQALGMGASSALHPTVQRFVLDEDCVFLLCSDGLSDNDRVEQYWQTELLPILDGQIDLPTAGERLVQIANSQNGHDNATVALVYCQVTPSQEPRSAQPPQMASVTPPATSGMPTRVAAPSQMKTQQLPTKASNRRPWGLLLGILLLLGLGSAIAYVLIPRSWIDPIVGGINPNFNPSPTLSPASPPLSASPAATPSGISSLEEGTVIQIGSSVPNTPEDRDVPLLLQRDRLPPQNQSVVGFIPTDSILQVLNEASEGQQERWLQVRVCIPGSSASVTPTPESTGTSPQPPQSPVGLSPATPNTQQTPGYRRVARGDGGWIREAELLPSINQSFTPTPAQRSECGTSTPAVSPTPTPAPPRSP
ncbi:MAG: protein phosphatase 2C domain-containing protein [Coleofasciculus sp. S288]|nr:protein phosphatase 2C domain-containing protein [Coleofasciculus sp. S288]